jgi:hypothetical protein
MAGLDPLTRTEVAKVATSFCLPKRLLNGDLVFWNARRTLALTPIWPVTGQSADSEAPSTPILLTSDESCISLYSLATSSVLCLAKLKALSIFFVNVSYLLDLKI